MSPNYVRLLVTRPPLAAVPTPTSILTLYPHPRSVSFQEEEAGEYFNPPPVTVRER